MTQPGHDVCAGNAEQFLVRVKTVAVFDCEHAAQSGRLHHTKKKTTQRQGQQVIEVGNMNRWESEWRQPLWHLAQQFHAEAAEIHTRSTENARDDDEQGDRFVLEKSLA